PECVRSTSSPSEAPRNRTTAASARHRERKSTDHRAGQRFPRCGYTKSTGANGETIYVGSTASNGTKGQGPEGTARADGTNGDIRVSVCWRHLAQIVAQV
ncbi:MAG: hypothetical protein ACREO8_03165, partial [Luteimonas sp.]